MNDNVKRRNYDSSGRRTQSGETRQRIIVAARDLMLQDGYRGTSIAMIAKRAAVNSDTVYQLVGRKPDLLRELLEQAVSGTDRAVPAQQRDYVTRIRAEADPRTKLALYATAVSQLQQRLAPLYKVIREASPSEPAVSALWKEISERRYANMMLFVNEVADAAGGLQTGWTVPRAAELVWTLNSPDVFLLLTEERRRSPEDVATWLASAWERLLLPTPDATPGQ